MKIIFIIIVCIIMLYQIIDQIRFDLTLRKARNSMSKAKIVGELEK